MKLIVGLGNPGKDYIQSRHNIGFIAIDKILSVYRLDLKIDMKLQSAVVKTKIEGEDVILAKPLTYMNLSGQAVHAIMNYYKIPPEDVLIILDDTALPLGKVRLRETGSHGGQNGLKDIINRLKTKDIKRLRVGIGKHEHMNTSDFVLGKFTPREIDVIKDAMDIVYNAVTTWVTTNNFNNVMTKYNTPQTD